MWPPYAVPTQPGQVVAIGTNKPGNVKPSQVTVGQWHYALFDYYGGGAFIDDYSAGGAWAVAGSGGHGVSAANIGACVFDFQDATWKLHLAAHAGAVPRQNDFAFSECTGGYINGTTPPCPAPAHVYAKQGQLRSSQGGGQMGSYLRLRGDAVTATGGQGSGTRAFDLSTNLWSVPSTGTLGTGRSTRDALYDQALNRWYIVPHRIGDPSSVFYLDGIDMAWKTDTVSQAAAGGTNLHMFLDQQRHMIVVMNPATGLVRALDLDNSTAWKTLTIVGASLLDSGTECQWQFYPPDGCYYSHRGNVARNYLTKLTPPPIDNDPFAGTWTVSQLPLLSALPPINPAAATANAQHHNRFFKVESLQCFAWIPGWPRNTTSDQVFLIKP